MTDQRIAEIEARCEAATQGPWENGWSNGATGPTAACFIGLRNECGIVCKPREVWAGEYYAGVICRTAVGRIHDADFIAHAREDIPFLLSRLAARDTEIERLREAQRWIPVSEMYPGVGQRVLVWNGADHPTHVATFTIGGRPKDRWFYDDGYGDTDCWIDGVTHWIPLPAAPDHLRDATKMITHEATLGLEVKQDGD